MGLDADEVVDGLWIGSQPDPKDVRADQFDVLVLCAEEYQPPDAAFDKNIGVVRLPIPDLPEEALDVKQAMRYQRTALALNAMRSAGGEILVTCHRGLNRSAAVVALMLVFGPEKMEPKDAIDLTRKARGDEALDNPQLVKLILHARPS